MQITIVYHYFVFGAWEANMIVSGLGYRPKSEKEPEEYNSIRSVICFNFSSAITATQGVSSWNLNTANWMKYYIQLRLIDRDQPRNVIQIWPMLAVFISSAAWHGPELGFSVFFFTLFMNSIIAKFFEKTKLAQTVLNTIPWPVLYVPLWIWNYFQLSFGGMAFKFLTLRKFNHVHAAFGYCLYWMQPLLLVIAILLPKVKKTKEQNP